MNLAEAQPPLFRACTNCHGTIVQMLLQHGANVDEKVGNCSETALNAMMLDWKTDGSTISQNEAESLKIIQMLLESSTDINYRDATRDEITPLEAASEIGDLQLLDRLLAFTTRPVDPNIRVLQLSENSLKVRSLWAYH